MYIKQRNMRFKIKNIISENQLDAFKSDKSFDFEDFEDTDLDGPYVEMAIDNLISEVEDALQKQFPADPKLREDARLSVKDIWKVKIAGWRDRNKGAGIPGGKID